MGTKRQAECSVILNKNMRDDGLWLIGVGGMAVTRRAMAVNIVIFTVCTQSVTVRIKLLEQMMKIFTRRLISRISKSAIY
jgi:hypothetical protein